MASNETRCKGCNQPIKFIKNEAGKLVPLDMSAPVYEVTKDFTGSPVARLAENFYVSHFKLCPKADQFSASRKP